MTAVGQEESGYQGEVAHAHDAPVPCGRTEVKGEVGEEKRRRRRRRKREEQQQINTDAHNYPKFISPSILATTEHIIQSCVTVQVENKDCSVTYFNCLTTLKALYMYM